MTSSTIHHHQNLYPPLPSTSRIYTQQVQQILQTAQHHYRQQQQQQQILDTTHQQNNENQSSIASSHPPIKIVYDLFCRHCNSNVCTRGMKSILLADTHIELYSTDTPTSKTHLMEKDYLTHTCPCRIRDVACLDCGNIIGYHVVSPCKPCLSSCNNGHFWMFHSDVCRPTERKDVTGKGLMLWDHLPRPDKDISISNELSSFIPHEQILR
ncbi:unnamed protein product [Cunninghamella blakesleeana]